MSELITKVKQVLSKELNDSNILNCNDLIPIIKSLDIIKLEKINNIYKEFANKFLILEPYPGQECYYFGQKFKFKSRVTKGPGTYIIYNNTNDVYTYKLYNKLITLSNEEFEIYINTSYTTFEWFQLTNDQILNSNNNYIKLSPILCYYNISEQYLKENFNTLLILIIYSTRHFSEDFLDYLLNNITFSKYYFNNIFINQKFNDELISKYIDKLNKDNISYIIEMQKENISIELINKLKIIQKLFN